MIHYFAVKNFYSFRKTSGINFEVNKNAPETKAYIEGACGKRVTKVMTVIGPNASGKTNLLKVIPFISFFITSSSYDLRPNEEIPFKNFQLTPINDQNTEITVEFEIKKKLYLYRVQLNRTMVLLESLKIYNKKTKKFSVVFTRKWNSVNKEYKFISDKRFNLVSRFYESVRKNVSVISAATQLDNDLSNEIYEYWYNVDANVAEMGKHSHDTMNDISEIYAKNKKLKEVASRILSKFNLGLIDFSVEKFTLDKMSNEERYVPFFTHKSRNKAIKFPYYYESAGTISLYKTLVHVLSRLNLGGIAVLDDFDSDLHPHMLPELVKLFISKDTNPKNAQLLFTTHHHEVLNNLDKYQITLVEKNEETGESESWRLDEIEGVRPDDNYYAKYFSGSYGAIPEV